MWHKYSEFDAAEAFLQVEIRAKVVQTFLQLDQSTTAPPGAASSTENGTTQQGPDSEMKQQENENNGSPPPVVNMNGRTNMTQPGSEMCDPMAGSRLQDKLRDLAAKRRQAYSNNNGAHTQPTQDTIHHVRKRPYDPPTGTSSASKLMKEEVNAKPATADTTPEEHPAKERQRPINNNVDRYTHEQGASSQPAPDQEPPKEDDPPPTTTTPTSTKRNVAKRTRRYHARGDLITIYELDDEVKLEENLVDTHTLHIADR